MFKNRILALGITGVLAASMLSGCGTSLASSNTGDNTENAKYSVVASTFPSYDWVKELTEGTENFDITYLASSGVDLHSYQASATDIAEIGTSDLFIYVGGESDGWAEDALDTATNANLISINMMDELSDSIVEEEVVEGMEAEEESEEADTESADEAEEVEYDEHVWLSLKNAQTLVSSISDALQQIDPEEADTIAANAQSYLASLQDLDNQYQETVDAASTKTVLFGDRFPFRYLVDDYGLDYYAAFVGCSAESEASFETITFLADKVDSLGLNTILTIENSDQKIAETIRDNTASQDQEILVMDSLQSVSQDQIDEGKTYLDTMTSNLDVLKAALN